MRNQVINSNEARAEIGLNPREGGDEYGTPGAPSPQKTGGDNDETADNDGDKKGKVPGEKDNGDDEDRHLLRRVVFNVCNRARHKAGKSPEAFLEWVDSGLKYHREELARLVPSVSVATVIDPLAKRFDGIASDATGDVLAASVDKAATDIELNFVDSLGLN